MNAGKAIFSQLTGDTAVKVLIGTRVFPQLVPDRLQYPQVVYDLGVNGAEPSFDGKSLDKFSMHILSVATDYDAASDLADAVTTSLDNGAGVWGGITVLGCWLESSEPEIVTIPDAQEQRVYMIDQIYTLVCK